MFATLNLDASGHAIFSGTFPAGAHNILAVYSGDGNYSGSSSAMTQMVVNQPSRRRAAGH